MRAYLLTLLCFIFVTFDCCVKGRKLNPVFDQVFIGDKMEMVLSSASSSTCIYEARFLFTDTDRYYPITLLVPATII